MPAEEVNLLEASGRILAHEIVSQFDVPAFARSMMDGYALRADETHGATSYNPVVLDVIGSSYPGKPLNAIVQPGQAVRIMTGAPVPDGADAVLAVEQTETDGTKLLAGGEVPAGRHIGLPGEDIRRGDIVLPSGRPLRPQDVGILSALGIGRVPVVRPPRVRILITGNELLPAGTSPSGFRIADSNGPMLSALVNRDGGAAVVPEMIPDDPDRILESLQQPADVILVSGGSSAGQEDHVPVILGSHGELAIHGIAMRPSSPTGMGLLNGALVFLLPGNPVSCLCAYDFFAGRAIRFLSGKNRDWPYRKVRLTTNRKLVSVVGRLDYARVRIVDNRVEPLAISGASVLSSTTRADGFVLIPDDSEGIPAEGETDVYLY